MSRENIEPIVSNYLGYFVQDFTKSVLKNIPKTCPVNSEYLAEYVDMKTSAFFSEDGLTGRLNGSDITKFVHECAQYAVESNLPEADSYETWYQVSKLPSVYDQSIQDLIFNTSKNYVSMIDETITGLIMQDTHTAVESIRGKLADSYKQIETGGSVHKASWGLLDNAIWLSSACTIAFDSAKAFRPGDPYKVSYVDTCFSQALSIPYEAFDRETATDLRNSINVIIGSCDESAVEDFQAVNEIVDVCDLLAYNSSVDWFINKCKSNLNNAKLMLEDVSTLSSLITSLSAIKDIAVKADDSIVSTQTVERIDTLTNILTLTLVSYEALRETTYKDSLVFYSDKPEDSFLVDVYVNPDNVNQFLKSGEGREEKDLLTIGTYAAMNPAVMSNRGISLSVVDDRLEDMRQHVLANEYELRNENKNGYRNQIRTIVTNELTNIVSSYHDMYNVEQTDDSVKDRIKQIAIDASALEQFDFEGEVYKLLLSSTNNKIVEGLGIKLVENLSSEEVDVKASHKALAVAESAIESMVEFLYA